MSTLEATSQDLARWAEAASRRFLPLPPSVYTCPEWFQKEIETIFHKEWILAGHISELENPNDYLTIDIYDKPILAVRDDKKNIRAFSNVCQHRSAIIAKGKGNKKLFSCPYHAWSYGSDGKLKNAPYMDKDVVKDVCLPEYKVEIWQGMVFVNLDTEATPLAPRLEKLEPRYAPYRIEDYKVILRDEIELECNWKALVENFCENYHLFCVHPNSLEPDFPTLSTEIWEGGPGFNHGTSRSKLHAANSAELLARLPKELHDIQHIGATFPCVAGGLDPKICLWLIVLPTGPQTIKFTALGVAHPEVGEDEIPEDLVKFFKESMGPGTFMDEDKAILRIVQRGLAAGTGQAAPSHPLEQTNWEFGHYLARTVLGIDTMQRPENPPWPPLATSQ